MTAESLGGGRKRGRAEVWVVNDLGDPVAGATVSGEFTGGIEEAVVGVTGADGLAVLVTVETGEATFSSTFCVTDIDALPLVYDSASNVETCDSR